MGAHFDILLCILGQQVHGADHFASMHSSNNLLLTFLEFLDLPLKLFLLNFELFDQRSFLLHVILFVCHQPLKILDVQRIRSLKVPRLELKVLLF